MKNQKKTKLKISLEKFVVAKLDNKAQRSIQGGEEYIEIPLAEPLDGGSLTFILTGNVNPNN